VRAQLVHDGAPAASGHVSFRAVVPAGRAPGDLLARSAVLWAGPRCHLVHYPIAGGDRFNLVATYEDPACTPVSGQPVASEEVTARFPHPAAVPRAWLAAGTDWSKWVLCDRPPTRRWQDGAVVLAGDAAHPMLQYAAQGAAMALEDAACLAGHVDGPSPDYEKLFARYVEDRRERTARVQRVSRLLGERLYHVGGADARDRDALLARMTPDDLHAELGWLFGD
jgi:salicylate hydroxylase